MSQEETSKLSASAKEWVVEPEPISESTRFRHSIVPLGNNHLFTNCHTDGNAFCKVINTFLVEERFEEAKLQIERCRDSRIQETLSFSTCDTIHNILIDLYVNLREAFEVPLSSSMNLSYIYDRYSQPPQYFILSSPSPISEAPWYGATAVKITNEDVFIMYVDPPENYLLVSATSSTNKYTREFEKAIGLYTIVSAAGNLLPNAKKSSSCMDNLLQLAINRYNTANYILTALTIHRNTSIGGSLHRKRIRRKRITRRVLRQMRQTKRKTRRPNRN